MPSNISPEVRAVVRDAVAIRRAVHQHPELGFQEKKTHQLIRGELKKSGLESRPLSGTGVVALVRGAKPGKTLLIRADIDALPVTELNDVPYKSKRPGLMHACGHDGHVAMSLMAARVLQKRRSSLKGNVKFMFQPAEEGPGGALPMIQAGLLKSPTVDAALALHMWNELPTGTLGVREGPVFASVDEFTLRIIGKGGHGAAPYQTIDPIVTAANLVNALQTIVSRRIDPLDSAVVTIGKIEGGTRFNIIPDTATLYGTVRSFKPEVRKKLKEEIYRVTRGVTQAHGATFDMKYLALYPASVNDEGITKFAGQVAAEVVGKRGVVRQPPTMGSEDMSYVLQKVPGCYVLVGSAGKGRHEGPPHHSPRFDFDEEALPLGIEFLVRAAERYLVA